MYYFLTFFITALGLSFWLTHFMKELRSFRGIAFFIGFQAILPLIFIPGLVIHYSLDYIARAVFLLAIIGFFLPLYRMKGQDKTWQVEQLLHPVYILLPLLLLYILIFGLPPYTPGSWDEWAHYLRLSKQVLFLKEILGNLNPLHGTGFSPGYYPWLIFPKLVFSQEFSIEILGYFSLVSGLAALCAIYDFFASGKLIQFIPPKTSGCIIIFVLMSLFPRHFFPNQLLAEPILGHSFSVIPIIAFLVFRNRIKFWHGGILLSTMLLSGILFKKSYISWAPACLLLLIFLILRNYNFHRSKQFRALWKGLMFLIMGGILFLCFRYGGLLSLIPFRVDDALKDQVLPLMLHNFVHNWWMEDPILDGVLQVSFLNLIVIASSLGLLVALFIPRYAVVSLFSLTALFTYSLGLYGHYSSIGVRFGKLLGYGRFIEPQFWSLYLTGFWLLLVMASENLWVQSLNFLKGVAFRRICILTALIGIYFLYIEIEINLKSTYFKPNETAYNSIKRTELESKKLAELLAERGLSGSWMWNIAQRGPDLLGEKLKFYSWGLISEEKKKELIGANINDAEHPDYSGFKFGGSISKGETKTDHWMEVRTAEQVKRLLIDERKILWIVRTDPWMDRILDDLVQQENCAKPYNRYFLIRDDHGKFECIPRDATRKTCQLYLDQGEVKNGIYRLDPDGFGPIEPFDAYCDMNTDGGGWTLIVGINSQNTFHRTKSAVTPDALVQQEGKGKYSDITINQLPVHGVFRFQCGPEQKVFFRHQHMYGANNPRVAFQFALDWQDDQTKWYSSIARGVSSWAGFENYIWAAKNDSTQFISYYIQGNQGCTSRGQGGQDGKLWVR